MHSTKDLVLAGLFIAIGIILPFFTGQIPEFGNMLLPMHIPVLLSGYVLGGPMGLIIGFILPLFRSFLFNAPPMFPAAVSMSFELATYGLVTGLLYKSLPKNKINIYLSLTAAMIAGRIVWGLARLSLYGIQGTPFNITLFVEGAILLALPGIIIQLALIPILVMILEKKNLLKKD